MSHGDRVHVRMPTELVGRMDRVIEASSVFEDRSHYVRTAVRQLNERKVEELGLGDDFEGAR